MEKPHNSAIYRILDANLDRAREGIRVIEEWCRFSLRDLELADQCKHLRHELAQLHRPIFRQARDTLHDPGTQLTHIQEQSRASPDAVLQANLARTQESLRVLEEYSKLCEPAMADICKQMRYQIYTLESQLSRATHHSSLRSRLLRDPYTLPDLYLVTSPSETLVATVKAALKGGLKLVQHRDKDSSDSERLHTAHQLCQLCHQHDALFIVNDRVDIALAVNADGVHLGQQDVPMALARQILGPEKVVGRSTTNVDEMERAIKEKADYIGVGPIFATPTKVGKAPVGLDYIQYVSQNSPMPWYAIGGIDEQNLTEVLAAGAEKAAVVRAIMQDPNPTEITQRLLKKFPGHNLERSQ
ncbi:Thiamine-phosphate synthase [Acaryochloris thomasi RCC1774]|uniref:Thiamine-phosphate synthase n=1 Tax=Acaryochloris thomasi RCC1774 TaxID=1764569 RepID=A0A2W1K0T9_9CYAN|nr:thiamine phosphate synthase [Acaryochloris thomasi]PZD74201.1 Thiamine-phosphate synthase [Acaryochloris thomasi RCC1774]